MRPPPESAIISALCSSKSTSNSGTFDGSNLVVDLLACFLQCVLKTRASNFFTRGCANAGLYITAKVLIRLSS